MNRSIDDGREPFNTAEGALSGVEDRVGIALAELRAGRFVIVVDDKDRENEGDLIMAAERATAASIAFAIRHTGGLICVSLPRSRLDQLKLPPMVPDNTESRRTAFTISVDVRQGITTGISAYDRAATIQALTSIDTRPEDLARPGHVFPLRYTDGGVLKRAGHTEAAVDLCRLAGLAPAGVLSELINEDGTMSRAPELHRFAVEHEIPMLSVADLIQYRSRRERLVNRVAQVRLPTEFGEFTSVAYSSTIDELEHLALVFGSPSSNEATLVRVHSECLTGDVFGSRRCDCGIQLKMAIQAITQEGSGIIVYLRGHEGRGIGLGSKFNAYELQDKGRDTVEANLELGFPVDARHYGIAAQILTDLGVSRLKLMTNNPAKARELTSYGLEIVTRVPLVAEPTNENIRYLRTKQSKMGHNFSAGATRPIRESLDQSSSST